MKQRDQIDDDGARLGIRTIEAVSDALLAALETLLERHP
jgi:hypothetical protein